MSLLFEMTDMFAAASTHVAGFVDGHVVANVLAVAGDPADTTPIPESTQIVRALVKFVLPLVLLVIGFYSVKFLMQRQMTQFFQFMAVAVLVVMLIVNPGIIQKIANWFAGIF